MHTISNCEFVHIDVHSFSGIVKGIHNWCYWSICYIYLLNANEPLHRL